MLQSGMGLSVPRGLVPVVGARQRLIAALGQRCCSAAASAMWFRPRSVRARIWMVFDVLLACAVAWAVFALPSQPPAAAPHALALPVLRLVLITLGVLRLLVRLLPPVLSGI